MEWIHASCFGAKHYKIEKEIEIKEIPACFYNLCSKEDI
jgi:hypothetical protein